jgi:hypothetical protein
MASLANHAAFLLAIPDLKCAIARNDNCSAHPRFDEK